MVLKDHELRDQILGEAHSSKLSIHPSSSKMYHDMKTHFWWTKIKKEVTAYVARCDTCSRVKADHLKPARLLQPLSIPGVSVSNKHQLVNLYLLRVRLGWCTKGHKVCIDSGRMSLRLVHCCSCY